MLRRIKRSGDAAMLDGSPAREGCGGCQEDPELFNPCLHSTPGRNSNHANVTPLPADRAAAADDGSFSIVEWISQSLPCMGGAAEHVHVSRDDSVEVHIRPQQQRQRQTPQPEPSDSNSWCDLSTIAPCPTAFGQLHDNDDDGDHHPVDYVNLASPPNNHALKGSPNHSTASAQVVPASNSSSSFLPSSNHQASSWLSGHLGLIPAPTASNSSNATQQQVVLTKPPSLIKTASLTKPPSFTQTSSFTQATASTSVSSSNHNHLNHHKEQHSQQQQQQTRPKSPSSLTAPPQMPIRRKTSQTIVQSIQQFKLLAGNPSSRSNSRSNTPVNETNSCGVVSGGFLLSNKCGESHDGLDSNSSVGLNSMQQQQQQQQQQDSRKKCNTGGATNMNILPSTTCAAEQLGFHCGTTQSIEEPSVIYPTPLSDSIDRNRSGATVDTTGGTNPKQVVDNISKLPPCSNSSIMDSFMSSSLLSSHPQPSSRITRNKRSPSPLFGTQKVQLEKFLSRNNHHNNKITNPKQTGSANASECGTITTDGASGYDASAATNTGTSKRKVQWGSGSGGTTKMPVLITANEDSTEVTNRESIRQASGKSSSSLDVRSFASYHEEIVTALIESALQGDHVDSSEDDKKIIPSSSMEPTPIPSAPDSVTTSSPKRHSLTPIRKIRRNGSPHRASSSLSTPLWKRNRSSLNLGKVVMKHERRMSDADEKGMFHFKKSATSAATAAAAASKLEKKPLDYFHPQCRLMKEKGSEKRRGTDGNSKLASAVGRDAVLEKLQEKLSMLGDIESGKYGKAAEMLQSDAVAFSIPNSDSADKSKQLRHVRSGSHGSSTAFSRTDSYTVQESANDTSISSAGVLPEKRKAVVETRSLLTLRMGFVSISYGILLQWDIESRLVELIVLRKMCREDFLERTNEDNDFSTAAATKSTKPSTVSAESSASGTTMESCSSRSEEPGGRTGLSLFPQLLSEPDQRPKSFLSVSVVNVKHIHTGCDLCTDSAVPGSKQNGTKSKEKRVIRPYIRFVLGKNEHCTKPAKLLPNGHLYYYKRHNNSCMLPMPKEEFRWFAGQEDLIVEVRDNVQSAATKIKGTAHRKNKYALGGKNATKSNKDEQSSSTDPILAVVTVPLSSVNIEDEEHKISPSDGEESVSLSPWKGRKSKTHEYGRDGTSSTNIKLPLRMVGCSAASFGSISLQITVKAQRQSNAAPQSSQPINSTSEPNVISQESIEIGAIARIMQGWAIYDSGATDDENTKASKSRRRKIRRPQPVWNKKWNPKTKRWSRLKLSSHGSSRNSSSEQASWLTFLT